MKISSIKRCPFCGSKDLEIARSNENACWVECPICSGQTYSTASRNEAIEAWNARDKDGDIADAEISYDDTDEE